MARPAADPELLRTRILDAAELLLGRYGYRKMTMDDLAAEAGVSKGAVYLHFASKEDIALARIDRVIAELILELDRIGRLDRPVPERLRAMLVTRVVFRLERVRAYRDTIDQVVAAIRPRLLVARRVHYRREATVFGRVVREGIRRLEIRACAAARVGEALVVATNGLLPADLRPEELDPAEVRRRVGTIAERLIHGLVLGSDR